MIEARGVVLKTADHRAWVRVDDQPAGCGRCQEPGGCGGARIAYAFGKPDDIFQVDNPQRFSAGDHVRLQIDDGAALGAAAISYGLPTLAALIGAGVGTWWSGNAGAVGGLVVALAISIAVVRKIGGRRFWRQKLSVRVAADTSACAHAVPVSATRHD